MKNKKEPFIDFKFKENDIIILGIGGHAGMCIDILINQKKFNLVGFIDKSTDYLKLSRIGSPVIANGNTTLRVDMTTTKDFGTSLINDLSHELNQLHNVNYPVRFWQLLIGSWLMQFLSVL